MKLAEHRTDMMNDVEECLVTGSLLDCLSYFYNLDFDFNVRKNVLTPTLRNSLLYIYTGGGIDNNDSK